MKILITLILFSTSVSAAECKLTGLLLSEHKIETTMGASTVDDCRNLLQKASENNFFGLVENGDALIEARMAFKTAEGSKRDSIHLNPSDN